MEKYGAFSASLNGILYYNIYYIRLLYEIFRFPGFPFISFATSIQVRASGFVRPPTVLTLVLSNNYVCSDSVYSNCLVIL